MVALFAAFRYDGLGESDLASTLLVHDHDLAEPDTCAVPVRFEPVRKSLSPHVFSQFFPAYGETCIQTGAVVSRVRRALIVDDDAAIRILITRILSRHGLAVDAVCDGAEAIEMLLQHDYDVIALDLMMPRIDGFGVVHYLVEHHPELLPRVFVMTAFGSEALSRVCPPVERFIEKPFDVNRLIAEASLDVGQSAN